VNWQNSGISCRAFSQKPRRVDKIVFMPFPFPMRRQDEINYPNTNPSERKNMKRTASAVWQGNLKDGKGTVSTESGALSQTPYSFSTRFENARGTNPEELIAAAHAGC